MSAVKNVHKLTIENEPAIHLLGIASHENDYRISWALNEALGLRFIKSNNHISFNKRIGEVQEFSMYISQSDENSPIFKLISNRCENGFLLEELKNIDYVLLISDFDDIFNISEIIKQIKNIQFISTIFPLNTKELKNLNRIII